MPPLVETIHSTLPIPPLRSARILWSAVSLAVCRALWAMQRGAWSAPRQVPPHVELATKAISIWQLNLPSQPVLHATPEITYGPSCSFLVIPCDCGHRITLIHDRIGLSPLAKPPMLPWMPGARSCALFGSSRYRVLPCHHHSVPHAEPSSVYNLPFSHMLIPSLSDSCVLEWRMVSQVACFAALHF